MCLCLYVSICVCVYLCLCFSECVCLCACVYVHMCPCMCDFLCVPVGGWLCLCGFLWVSICNRPKVKKLPTFLQWGLPVRLCSQPVSSRDPLVSLPSAGSLQEHATKPAFLHQCRKSTSDPHACAASTLPTGLPPRPLDNESQFRIHSSDAELIF